ncbi:MAG: hypothetical protein KC933_10810 [Myxococcales bacterium]|nr:hypothetical protein [Myxococcales bacterium]MCB9647325.1 hypothetical protein [Deltaproteobacteria bacterium]
MGRLANILEDAPEGPRGPDLRHTVRVPVAALGREGGVWVKVPSALPHEGRVVARRASGHDRRGRVQLHLPAGMATGTTLRLRGQGGLHDGGAAGDLYLEVEVVPRAPLAWGWWVLGGLVVVSGIAAAVAF